MFRVQHWVTASSDQHLLAPVKMVSYGMASSTFIELYSLQNNHLQQTELYSLQSNPIQPADRIILVAKSTTEARQVRMSASLATDRIILVAKSTTEARQVRMNP